MSTTNNVLLTSDTAITVPHPRRIQFTSLAQEAHQILQQMIVHGELAPGARIVELALCEQLQISRTPLREAIGMLVNDDSVARQPSRNAVVTLIDSRELDYLFETEAAIEGFAVELAASRMTNTDLKQLETMQERLEKLQAKGDRAAYFALNQRIHALLVAGAKNSVLEEMHRHLLGRLERARYLALNSPDRWQEFADEYRSILAALKDRNGELARRLLSDHVRHTGESITVSNR